MIHYYRIIFVVEIYGCGSDCGIALVAPYHNHNSEIKNFFYVMLKVRYLEHN